MTDARLDDLYGVEESNAIAEAEFNAKKAERKRRNSRKSPAAVEPVRIPSLEGETRRELADDLFQPLADLINNGAPKQAIRKEERRLKKLHKQMMRA